MYVNQNKQFIHSLPPSWASAKMYIFASTLYALKPHMFMDPKDFIKQFLILVGVKNSLLA